MTARSPGPRRSRRAASSAWMVGGMAMSGASIGDAPLPVAPDRAARRSSIETSCSTNRGLPSAASIDPRADGRREPGAAQQCSTMAPVWSAPRGPSAIRSGRRPRPMPGARPAARAAPCTETRPGTRCVSPARCSIRSSSVGLRPVDVVDRRRTTGPRSARISTQPVDGPEHLAERECCLRSIRSRTAMRSATSGSPDECPQLRARARGESSSSMPAASPDDLRPAART